MNLDCTFRLILVFIVSLSVRSAQAQSEVEIADLQNIENVQVYIEKYKSTSKAIGDDEMYALFQLEEALQELKSYIKEAKGNNLTEIADRYCEAAMLVDSFGQPFQPVERVMFLGREYYWLGVSIGKKLASKFNYKGKCIAMGSWYDAKPTTPVDTRYYSPQ